MGLDLALAPHAVGEPDIETLPLFGGERVAVFMAIGHRLAVKASLTAADLADELLVVPRGDAGRALAGGRTVRAVRETGVDPRDVLFAVADGGAVALGAASSLRTAGELGRLVAARPLEPEERLPDTVVAWRAEPSRHLDGVLATVRAVAGELKG